MLIAYVFYCLVILFLGWYCILLRSHYNKRKYLKASATFILRGNNHSYSDFHSLVINFYISIYLSPYLFQVVMEHFDSSPYHREGSSQVFQFLHAMPQENGIGCKRVMSRMIIGDMRKCLRRLEHIALSWKVGTIPINRMSCDWKVLKSLIMSRFISSCLNHLKSGSESL